MDESISFSSKIENEDDNITSEDEIISDQEEDITLDRQKRKKKKRNILNPHPMMDHDSDENTESINEEMWLSKKQRKKLQQKKVEKSKKLQNNEVLGEEKQEAKSEE